MHNNSLPTKPFFLKIIVNREILYIIIRWFIMSILYLLMICLVIFNEKDTILYVDKLILHVDKLIFGAILLIIVGIYCYSDRIIKNYVNFCKEQYISDDTLKKLKDEEADIEGDIKILSPFISVAFGLIYYSFGGSINKEEFLMLGAVCSFFILTAFAYPDKVFHNRLVKCIEDKKNKKNNDILNSILEIKRLVLRNKKHKR